ncbi:T9SS type A sorting domain-containing protein [candidate division KSB1 bacterium]|nr:T9SS type A sorting domain-containing protein [candidate division KSB1 bacterium]
MGSKYWFCITLSILMLMNLNGLMAGTANLGQHPAFQLNSILNDTLDYFLWDNTDIDNSSRGVLSVELGGLPVGKQLFSAADDFQIPKGMQWRLKEFFVRGFMDQAATIQPDSFAVIIYADENGAPGTQIFRENVIVEPVEWTYNFYLTLEQPVLLNSGNYWLSIVAMYKTAMDISVSNWYWSTGPVVIGSIGYGQDQTGINGGYPWMRADVTGMTDIYSGVFAIFGEVYPVAGMVIPYFEADFESGHAPFTINFTDLSLTSPICLALKWSWDLDGDGTFDSEAQNPSWKYETPGIYNIILQAANDSTTDTLVVEDCIRIFDGESSLEFNGSTGLNVTGTYCPAAAALNLTEALTVEAWIKPTGFGPVKTNSLSYGYGRIVHKGAYSIFLHQTGDYGYAPQSIVIELNFADNTFVYFNSPENSVKLNEWQHLAFTYDGNSKNCGLLINGESKELKKLDGEIKERLIDNLNGDLIVGNRNDYYRAFDGCIDELRVWDRVREPLEIQTAMNHPLTGNEAGLMGYWPFNEGSADSALDLTGKNPAMMIYNTRWAKGKFAGPLQSVENQEQLVSQQFTLKHNYPNPFNPSTNIQFSLAHEGRVKLAIFDLRGREIVELVNDHKSAGAYSVQWNGQDSAQKLVPSGIYIYQIEIHTTRGIVYQDSEKMLLVK